MRVKAARHPGEAGRDGERQQPVAVSRHAQHLGDILVIVYREQTESEPRAMDRVGDRQRPERRGKPQQVEGRRRRRPYFRQRDGAEIHAGSAIDRGIEDDRPDDERDRQRDEREELSPDLPHAEDDGTERERKDGRHHRGGGQRPQERHVEARRQGRRRVHAGAEERAVTEGEVARVAGKDVPGRRQDDPVEDEVEKRLVEQGQAEQGNRRQHAAHDQHRGVDASQATPFPAGPGARR